MYQGFWALLPRPIIGLSPMDGVTDAPFRFIVAKYGRPSVIFTEFTSVEGLRAGALRLLDDFYYNQIERPIVAQLFGADPEAFYLGAIVAASLGFDGVDINMGCPAKNVTHHGAGAALILDPRRAQAIIQRTRDGLEAWHNGLQLEETPLPLTLIQALQQHPYYSTQTSRPLLPVSVKTRLGYSQNTVKEWLPYLLEMQPAVLTLHGRTLKQLYSGAANWEAIGEAALLCQATGTPLLGNGDIQNREDAQHKITTYGLAGVLIGRASQGNPWVFQGHDGTFAERVAVAQEHAQLHAQLFPLPAFVRMRKHLLDYIKGEEKAKALRIQLMRASSLSEVENILAVC